MTVSHPERRRRRLIALAAIVVLAAVVLLVAWQAGSAAPTGETGRAVVTIRTVEVGDPGNASVGIVPFQGPPKQGIYPDCTGAPSGCLLVGGVDYAYGIGELEITVEQYVAFLNAVDPEGRNELGLWQETISPTTWPKYGSISLDAGAGVPAGAHYAVAWPEWADKPMAFADFLDAARFVNALTNGEILSRSESTADGFAVTTYEVRLSPETERGIYDLGDRSSGPTRALESGFVVPSQDEWIKAAYYDPAGGGTDSYWQYPTGPFEAPNAAQLDPASGEVANPDVQPLAVYSPNGINAPAGTFPTWCPPLVGEEACATVDPLGWPQDVYQALFQASVSTVGQSGTRSPWGTLDQGGNVVEWTDTITESPLGNADGRIWRRMHGGIANARAYQLWISAVGLQPQVNPFFEQNYPWQGFRVGVIGAPGVGASVNAGGAPASP